jgi:hypothetical protein
LAVPAIVAALALGHAGVADAQELTVCQAFKFGSGDPSDPAPFQRMLAARGIGVTEVLVASTDAAVGAQQGLFWINDARNGWSVAVAPGPLDLDAAKADIEDQVRARLVPEQAAWVNAHLSVWATPYSEAELRAIQNPLFAALGPLNQGWGLSAGVACVPGEPEGFRVVAELATGDAEPTPELQAQVAAVAAPYGDKVRVNVVKGDHRVFPAAGVVQVPPPNAEPPAAPPAPAPLRVATYVSLPKTSRCVRGRTLTVKARRDASLAGVSVTARSRTVALKAGKQTRVRLAGKRTKLTLKVTTRDGRSASQAYTFRRC